MESKKRIDTHVKCLEKKLGTKLKNINKEKLQEIYKTKQYTPKTVKWIKSILRKHNCETNIEFNISRYNEYPKSNWINETILNNVLEKSSDSTKYVILQYACLGKLSRDILFNGEIKYLIGEKDWTDCFKNLHDLFSNNELTINMSKHRKEFKKLSSSPRGIGFRDIVCWYRRNKLLI